MRSALRHLSEVNQMRPFIGNVIRKNRQRSNQASIMSTLYLVDDSAIPSRRVAKNMLQQYTTQFVKPKAKNTYDNAI